MPPTVSSVICSTYDEAEEAVSRAVDLLGGISSFVQPTMTVLIKPNLLAGAAPERAVTTHPAVISAVAKLLTEYGCSVVIGDSPGAGTRYTVSSLRKAYERSGFAPLCAIPAVTLNEDISHTTVASPNGHLVKRFLIISPAVAADAVISLSKPKTHLLTTYTGAVKNLFGIIPGHEKSLFHSRFPDADDFSEMLLDLHGAVIPVLHLMDAVIGMEGNGPLSGDARQIGLILASRDPHALDLVACRTIGIAAEIVPTLMAARSRGYINSDPEIRGDDPLSLKVLPFRLPDTARPAGLRMKITRKALARLQRSARFLAPYPEVIESRCIGCGACVRICPAEAATLRNRRAEIDLGCCIRCYCCHESCEERAILITEGLFSRLLFGRRQ
jgi:uncharacterized protein (DUF362 family)/Pyruvate/2-oxoacid:ferredoxin oxidoreductase delta subunit